MRDDIASIVHPIVAHALKLHERLKSFALLENVGDAALRNLLAEANWFALPGGTLLERDGDNNAALFLVITGSLGVFVSDEQAQRQHQ